MAKLCQPTCARPVSCRISSLRSRFAQSISQPDKAKHIIGTRAVLRVFLLIATLLAATLLPPAVPATAKTKLWLPTPVGQKWKIIQGYSCGTHTGNEDRYALDLVNAEGKTTGAPVRAAAAGTIWVWVPRSGTLILSHGDNFYTQYTHLDSVVSTKRGTSFKRGQVIGAAGDRATRGNPHLHFAAFESGGRGGRRSVPLSFVDGPNLPESGGCSQHQGLTFSASASEHDDKQLAPEDEGKEKLSFTTDAEPERWYSGEMKIAFEGAGRGYSIGWDEDPGGDAPQHEGDTGNVKLADAGEGLHTLHVRAWDADGQQTVYTYGPVGYDKTAPRPPREITIQTIAAEKPAIVRWNAAQDKASGVAGYHVYLGTDKDGTAEWYSETPEVKTPKLASGAYLLRVSPIDYAGNAGKWTTVATVTVEES